MVWHPALSLMALVAFMTTGALSVSSTVEMFLVDTSWRGLNSVAGVFVSVACSILSLAAVAFLLLVALGAGGGEDDDHGHEGDDEPPAPQGPSGEPTWWPDFEREFEAYLREPEHSRSGGDTPSTIPGNKTR
jgi:hypothetical protein